MLTVIHLKIFIRKIVPTHQSVFLWVLLFCMFTFFKKSSLKVNKIYKIKNNKINIQYVVKFIIARDN